MTSKASLAPPPRPGSHMYRAGCECDRCARESSLRAEAMVRCEPCAGTGSLVKWNHRTYTSRRQYQNCGWCSGTGRQPISTEVNRAPPK